MDGAMPDLTPPAAPRDDSRQSQRLETLGRIAGGIAHDFNNLLTVIIGNLESADLVCGNDGDAIERRRRAIGNALRGAERAARLTRRLLAATRRRTHDPQPLDLNRLVAEEVEFLRRTLGESVAIDAIQASDLRPVLADQDELQVAILNLAVNARDAMPEGGRLTIETAAAGDFATLSIADTGIGMSEDVRRRALEPFFTTKDGHGTGLGLAQVHRFVSETRGRMTIDSAPGKGTRVTLYLPRHADAVGLVHDDRARLAI